MYLIVIFLCGHGRMSIAKIDFVSQNHVNYECIIVCIYRKEEDYYIIKKSKKVL